MSKNEGGNDQKNISRFFSIAKERVKISEFTTYSIVVAYYLLLSLFPLLITVGNILPFLSIDPSSVLPYIQEIMPSTIYQFLGPAIKDLLTQSSGGLLSISAITTIWSASKSINALQKAMNKSLGVEQRTGIVARILSVLVLILFLFAMVALSLIIGAGQVLLDAIQPIFAIPDSFVNIFQTVKWPLTFVALFLLMAIIYWMIPNVKMKLRSVLPGAIFATIGWLLLSQVFGLYARYFATTVSGYQIIGSFVVLMLWLNFAAMIIILGSVLNASMEEFYNGELKESDKIF
ncbi:MAG: YihY/virulence factor BrkB family protein [Tetragenococcus halophilus]|uniref:YihY/virulence factor BrkB family protein n=1 Tax=Tetragenococcus halophilus TaxID=51669 RepID=UPI001925DEA0|nr:YihY/virulence factor BrkB family protein [Tetragenococcus halophilus]MCF1601388.1 YihY/virulence factor BrkB family protein [Tetragenococcus halophilus]MCF1676555.1 YihY/virulence factor BrkB family protein [Tetragenococcus halophilus]MDN5831120.1 YihY/virulence factor BrkB family protein [Tetragenococcus halophilus]MDN6112313.1 YihY/virulence factor BrkB family protein [Tetragenococcus halophilus]MDN6141512.1 YihY/virulence factor BrkB family protein [Tetragenococcus halophilus]